MPLDVEDVANAVLLEIRNLVAPAVARLKTVEAGLAQATADRDRLAARVVDLETRPLVPGPPGPAGPPGQAGAPGPAGAIGKFADSYRDVYDPGTEYVRGDLVTDDGSIWLCKDATTHDRPGTSSAWKLIIKRGQHGRDAKGAK